MTSTRAVALAEEVLQNQMEKAEPLFKLLYAFKQARSDPEAEVMMDAAIQFCYNNTEHCFDGMKKFANDEAESSSIAA